MVLPTKSKGLSRQGSGTAHNELSNQLFLCLTTKTCASRLRTSYTKQVIWGPHIYVIRKAFAHMNHAQLIFYSIYNARANYVLFSVCINKKCFDCVTYLCNTRYQADAYNYEPLSLCVFLCVFVCVRACVRSRVTACFCVCGTFSSVCTTAALPT